MLDEGGYGHRELLLRTNSLASPWGYDDIVAAAKSGVHGVLHTHARDPDAVRAFVAAARFPFHEAGRDRGLEQVWVSWVAVSPASGTRAPPADDERH